MLKKLQILLSAAAMTLIPVASITSPVKADLYLQSGSTNESADSYTRRNYTVYAAVAANTNNGRWTWSTSYSTRSGAERAALRLCGDGCTVAISASNQQSQYLSLFQSSEDDWGVAYGDDLLDVRDRAKDRCEEVADYSCSESFTIRNIPDPSYSWASDELYVPKGASYDFYYDYYFGGGYL